MPSQSLTNHQVTCENGAHDNPAFDPDTRLDFPPFDDGEVRHTSRATSPGRKKKDIRRCVLLSVLIVLILFIALVSGIVAIVIMAVKGANDGNNETTTVSVPNHSHNASNVPDLEGTFRLMRASWDPAMADVTSHVFRSTATKYETWINKIYQASNLSNIVQYSIVTQLSKGSIIVTFHLYLEDLSAAADPATREKYQAAVDKPHIFAQAFQRGLVHLLTKEGQNPDLSDISLPSLRIQPATTTTLMTTRMRMTTTTTPTSSEEQSVIFPEPVKSCGVAGRRSGVRIIGGRQVEDGRYPWVVMIKVDERLLCGGTIMDPRHVISAAHCFTNVGFPGILQNAEVVAGEVNLDPGTWSLHVQRRDVARVYTHRDFNKKTQGDQDSNINDIAVLRLSRNMTLNRHVSAVCLPQVDDPLPPRCTVAGWGTTAALTQRRSQSLQMVSLWTYNSSSCKDTFATSFHERTLGQNISHYLTPGVMCAANSTFGGLDACSGDSGGPLFCGPDDEEGQAGAEEEEEENEGEDEAEEEEEEGRGGYTQFGVVSWGDGCAVAGSPGFYTYLPFYRPWLHRVALPVLDLLVKVGTLQCLHVHECGSSLRTASEHGSPQSCSPLSSAINCSLEHPRTSACSPAVARREVRQYAQYLNLEFQNSVWNITDCHAVLGG
ncbi:uncharacterized protein LOC143294301 [Babylonia areolata]|uniref:uncharacterized protein LOC143294301 n=1 Tax=Babylonia areolata TaxID=304850 RepID=UPI003FD30686